MHLVLKLISTFTQDLGLKQEELRGGMATQVYAKLSRPNCFSFQGTVDFLPMTAWQTWQTLAGAHLAKVCPSLEPELGHFFCHRSEEAPGLTFKS